jgi:hypothetical protein
MRPSNPVEAGGLGSDAGTWRWVVQLCGGEEAFLEALEPVIGRDVPMGVRQLGFLTLANGLQVVLGPGIESATKEAYSRALASTGTMGAVLVALEDAALQEQAARIVYYTASEPACRELLKDVGTWQRFFDLMTVPNVQRWVAAAVRPMVTGMGPPLIDFLYNTGCIFTLGSLLSSDLAEIKIHAMSAITAILKNSDLPKDRFEADSLPEPDADSMAFKVVTAVADADGMTTIVEAMKSRDLTVVAQAISLAAVLTIFPTIGRTLWETGIIRTLVAFLSQHPNEAPKTVQCALSILANLARPGHETCLQEIHALGGLNVAMNFLENADVGIREQSASLIHLISKDPLYCQEIIQCDGLPLLFSHLERDDMRIESPVFPVPLYYNALTAMVQVVAVCGEADVLVGLLQRGLLKCLASIMSNRNPHVVRQIVRLLHAFAGQDDPKVQTLYLSLILGGHTAGADSRSADSFLYRVIALLGNESAGVVEAVALLLTRLAGNFAPLPPERSGALEIGVASQTANAGDSTRLTIKRIVSTRAVPQPLLAIPNRFGDHPTASVAVLYLLSALVTDATVARRVVEAGGLPLVVRFMTTATDPEGARMAVRVFKALCVYADSSPELSMAIEFVAGSVQSEDRLHVFEAVDILEACSVNSACWTPIVEKALQSLIDLLLMDTRLKDGHMDATSLIMKVLHVIQRVSSLRSHAEAVTQMGGLFPIFHLLSGAEAHMLQGEAELVKEAVQTLKVILDHASCRKSVVEMGQGHILLQFVRMENMPVDVTSKALACLDLITVHSPAASGALASEKATIAVLADRIEESGGEGDDEEALRRVFYRIAAMADGPDAEALWGHLITACNIRTVVYLLAARPQGVPAGNMANAQARACSCVTNIVLSAEDPKQPIAHFVQLGVLKDLAAILAEVPSAMATLSVICESDDGARAALMAFPNFLSRAVHLIDIGREVSDQEEKEEGISRAKD